MSTTDLPLLGAALLAAAAVVMWPAGARTVWRPTTSLRAAGLPRIGRGGPGSARRSRGRVRTAARAPSSQLRLVPEAMELVAVALDGGASVAGAIRTVASTLPEPLTGQLRGVAAALQRGEDPAEGWAAAGPHWDPARRSLDLADSAGIPPAQALLRTADDLRRDAVADVEVAAARLGVRLVVPLGLAYLPAFVLTTVVPVVLALTGELSW
jgi:tight adherence protein B